VTDTVVDEVLSLPMFPELSEAQVLRVAETVKEALGS